MQDRRHFLGLTGAVALSVAAPMAATSGAATAASRKGRFYIVNGWILTGVDLVRLGLDDR